MLRPFGLAAGLFVAATLVDSCSAERSVASRPTLEHIGSTVNLLEPVRVSEMHYDNTGGDTGERVEISGPVGTSLAGWSLVFYNGSTPSNAVVYRTTALTGTFTANCGSRDVIVVALPADGIQNGPNDGFALVNNVGQVKELWSYEGSFTPAPGTPAAGVVPTAMGVSQNGTEPVGSSLHRDGTGVWHVTTPLGTNTFGACNDSDETPPAVVASVTVEPTPATLIVGNTMTFTATARDASDNPISGVTFSWTSTTPTVASVTSAGVATGLTPGSTTIRATAPNGVLGDAALEVEPVPPLPDLHIVELHYDNTGVDANEGIEIDGPAGANVSGWQVVLYNGNGGVTYLPLTNLTGTIPNQCAGRGTLHFPIAGIQNGPDGLALVGPGNVVVEFLSYGGTFTATNGPASGMTSVDIGVDQTGGVTAGLSLQKDAIGWYGPNPRSFGACNQALDPFVSITGRPSLPVGFEDGLFALLNDGRGGTSPTENVTWSSDTPALATIDADGVVHAHAAGTAVIRATVGSGPGAPTGTRNLTTFNATAGTAVYANHVEFGTPTDADASDEIVITRTEYTSSFSRTRGIPNWVSFNLEATHFGTEDRCDCFTFDPLIGGAWPKYTTADYTGVGGDTPYHGYPIDRGHLARSFDRTSGSLDNARTFYFSNIIPQAADNNRGPWSDFEFHVGDLARLHDKEVFVIAGASGSKGTVKDEGKITIPQWTWKVAVVLPRDQGLANVDSWDDLEVLAVIMPNDPGILGHQWETYATTVDAVEALSGYNLLALLPDAVESIAEAGMQDEMALVAQLVADGTLNQGNGNALTSKLEAAAMSISSGNTNAAKNQLGAFLNQVDAFEKTKKLSAAQAAALRSAINALIASL